MCTISKIPVTKIRKFEEDYAIQWKGDNLDEIKKILPKDTPIQQIDLMTLIINSTQYVFIQNWILIQSVIINNELKSIIGVCDSDTLNEIFDRVQE